MPSENITGLKQGYSPVLLCMSQGLTESITLTIEETSENATFKPIYFHNISLLYYILLLDLNCVHRNLLRDVHYLISVDPV